VGSKVEAVAKGDRINALPIVPCGECSFCRAGKIGSCAKKLIFGVNCDGAFAEFVLLPARVNVFQLPENLNYEAASCCEPLSVALQALDLSNIKPGHTAGVLGAGPIGLFTLQLLKAAGASLVMVSEITVGQKRLGIAKRLGADVIVNVQKEDAVRKAMDLGGGYGLDFVFEATGDPKAIAQALSMVRPEGKVIVIGIHAEPAQFNVTDLVRGRKSLIGSWGYDSQIWKRSLTLLSSGKISVEEMITHRIPLSDAREGFELAIRRGSAKIIFVP
jgi:2-desacetyl-2-hydroxyethyl bacteriochlorophyllide A dehydrogenase